MPFDTINDYIVENCWPLIECDNGHFASIAAHVLRETCIKRGWGDRIEDITPHLKCKRCGARAKKVWSQKVVGLGR